MAENEEFIINRLARIMQLRYQFYSRIYGTPYIQSSVVTNETTIYNGIIDLFRDAKSLSVTLKTLLDETFPNI